MDVPSLSVSSAYIIYHLTTRPGHRLRHSRDLEIPAYLGRPSCASRAKKCLRFVGLGIWSCLSYLKADRAVVNQCRWEIKLSRRIRTTEHDERYHLHEKTEQQAPPPLPPSFARPLPRSSSRSMLQVMVVAAVAAAAGCGGGGRGGHVYVTASHGAASHLKRRAAMRDQKHHTATTATTINSSKRYHHQHNVAR